LEIRGLEVSYGPVDAVRHIDLDVNRGEVVALIGPNGAGKTSTLRAISGLVDHRGVVTFDGRDCRALNIEGLARVGLIHVPEGRHVFPSLNVHENLQLGTTASAGRTDGYTIDDVYDLFPPLRDLRTRDGWALSGGEQQMVAVGRALVAKPRLLLLDEPSLGLSPKFARIVYDALARVSDQIPMLLVEQNTVMALQHSSRAAVMVGGKLVLEGAAEDLADREALVASYLGGEPVATGETAALRRNEKDLNLTGGDTRGRRHDKNFNTGRGLGPATSKRGESP
jgi:branched-chain amino acid transport system ATP-binding protein